MINAGFAEVDITPMPGMSCTSFSEPRRDKVNTSFSVTAAAFSEGGKKIVVAGIDAAVIQSKVYQSAFARLKDQLGVDVLLCGASHTHSGGPVVASRSGDEDLFRKIEDLSPEIRALGMERNVIIAGPNNAGNQKLNRQYLETFENAIVEVATQALDKLEPVRLTLGRATVEDVAYNRRISMRDGFVVTHPGALNPDNVGFAGPVDKELVALAAVNADGKTIGMVFNFACHATVDSSGDGFSADYPYYARETIRQLMGKEVTAVFLNGCCGDVTQINNMSDKPWRMAGNWAKILGRRVGFAAVDAIANGRPEPFKSIEFKVENLTLTYRVPPPKEYAAAVAAANTPPVAGDSKRWWAMGKVILNWVRKLHPEIPCELTAVKLGNLVICAVPGEAFSQTGLAIKQASPFPFTMISELTNNWLGYLPTADVFGPHGGGYEGEFKFGSNLEETAEEKIREKLIAMAASMRPEKEIVEEKAVPTKAGGGWWRWRNEKYNSQVS